VAFHRDAYAEALELLLLVCFEFGGSAAAMHNAT